MVKKLLILMGLVVLTACVKVPSVNDNPVILYSTAEAADPVQVEVERAVMFDALLGGGTVVYFAFNGATITADAQSEIALWADALTIHADFDVVIEGHCDERGSREYKLALGERRASAIRDLLIASGVDGDRIATISFGKERPAVSGHAPEAWALNRCGVIVLAN